MKALAVTSIRTRLLIVYLSIILLGFAALAVIAGGQISSSARGDYYSRLQNEIRLISQAVRRSVDDYLDGRISEDDLNAVFAEYETQTNGQLTLYRGQDALRPPRGTLRDLPELENALRGQIVVVERRNDAGEHTFYIAAPIGNAVRPMGLGRGILQLAVPAGNLQSIIIGRWSELALVFALVTGAAVLAASWLARSIIQPLYKLRESALHLSQGNFSHRVQHESRDEIGQVAQAFNEMARQVESMLEEQRAFASNTSHELRAPLTTIRLRTEALRYDSTLDAATASQYVEEIDDEVVRLGNLIQDLTLLSRFDAGRAELGANEVDMLRFAASLQQQIARQAAEKNIRVTLALPEDTAQPLQVRASLNHLTVVFRNLLDNAIKYTPENGQISWRIEQAENGVCSTLCDTGRGIDAEHLPRLFERFYRVDKARSRDIPGTGLGLSLVKSIVEAYGGQITITSEGTGKGTTVSVFWPYDLNRQDTKSAKNFDYDSA